VTSSETQKQLQSHQLKHLGRQRESRVLFAAFLPDVSIWAAWHVYLSYPSYRKTPQVGFSLIWLSVFFKAYLFRLILTMFQK